MKCLPIGNIEAVRRSTNIESSFNPQYCRSCCDCRIPDNLIKDKFAKKSIRIVQQQI